MIGIYKIENLINNKKYIGQSINIQDRWYHHRIISLGDTESYKLNQGLIHRAIKKYGIENFSFEVIEECTTNELDEKEIYWIAYYHTYIEDPLCHGYNLTPGGNQRLLIPVDQYDKMGQFIQTFTSVSEAANYASGICNLINCLKGRNPSSGGYQWRYHGEEPPGPLIYKVTDAHNWSSAKKSINQYTKDGQYIATFQSAHEAARSLKGKKNSGHISECCARKRKSAYGFIWKYASEDY